MFYDPDPTCYTIYYSLKNELNKEGENMSNRPDFLEGISPHHGEVVPKLFDDDMLKALTNKLHAMPNGETWYSDIYKKAIYGPMLFRDKKLNIQEKIETLLPNYYVLADLYLEKTPDDRGFPFHTDFDSIGFMERPEDMLTVWIPLVPVKTAGSGQLSIVMQEGAIRLSLIREAIQLHSLVRITDPSVPAHGQFHISQQELDYLEKTKFTPSLDAGDALLFCNAFFHKSEDITKGSRAAYILRVVPKNAKFSKTRLLALKKLGQNLDVVNELLNRHFPEN